MQPENRSEPGSAAGLELPKPRVLVVDDDPDIRSLLATMLGTRFEIEEAADGADAISIVASRPIAWVLSDVEMPRMSGLELARSMRARFPDVVLILMSGSGMRYRAAAAEAGAAGFVEKPFDLRTVLALVARGGARFESCRAADDDRCHAPGLDPAKALRPGTAARTGLPRPGDVDDLRLG